jgi:hypothetical protein
MIQTQRSIPFRRSALALAVMAAVGMPVAHAAPQFNEFSDRAALNDGDLNNPDFLVDHLISSDSGITRSGTAQFQGNLGVSGGDGGYGGYGGVGIASLGFDNDGIFVGNDNSSPFGDGFAESLWGGTDDASLAEVAVGDDGYGGPVFHGSASFYSNADLNEAGAVAGDFSLTGDGILLTSGVGTPPTENTSESFTGLASGQGDAGLDALLEAAGQQTSTTDATVLAFDFDLADGFNAIAFEYMFGTEEFPNFGTFNDIAAVFVNGRNVTVFPDGTALVVSNETFANQLFDNSSGDLDIEYDGVSEAQSIIVPLDPGTHSMKIAVSDANDTIYDTGFFVADLHGLLLEDGVTPEDPVLPGPDDDPSDGFDLTVTVGDGGIGIDPTTPIWIDPPVAVGYIIEVDGAGPNFATATLSNMDFGDGLFDVSWWNGSQFVSIGEFAKGNLINFLLINPDGISKFLIEGIETSAMLDPNDPTAFPVGVTFVNQGTGIPIKMTPITVDVPVPATTALFGLGLFGIGVSLRRRKAS